MSDQLVVLTFCFFVPVSRMLVIMDPCKTTSLLKIVSDT